VSTEVGKLYVQFDVDGRPYIQGLKDIDRRTQQFTRDQQGVFGKLGTKLGNAIKVGMAAGVAAVAYGSVQLTKSLIKTAASYEYEMSRIKAVTKASTAEMKAMGDMALKLGKDTQFSAGEAAQGINELAKAGVSVADILEGGIQGTLALAASGELEVARAAEIASNAMNVFGLSGEQVMSVADALSAAANASSLEVEDLAMSLQYIGPVASQLKIPMETVIGALAELAQVGIKGDMAGTGLRGMLNSLISPSSVARDAMAALNVELADTEGNIKPLPEILDEFGEGLEGLTEAEKMDKLGRIFDSQQLGVAMKLIADGSSSLEEWTKQVSVSGEAQRVAQTKMDNFEGSIEELRGSLETLSIKAGTPLIKWLRGVVDEGTKATNTIVDFWDDLQNVSGWEGADITGKIKIAWTKLEEDFTTWFEGMNPIPAKVYPVFTVDESGHKQLESMLGVPQGVIKAEIEFAESRDTGEEKLMAMGAKIGRGLADFLLGVGGMGGESVWAKAGKALADGFWLGFKSGLTMTPEEQRAYQKKVGGTIVTPFSDPETLGAAGKSEGTIYGGGFFSAAWGVISELWKRIFGDKEVTQDVEDGSSDLGGLSGAAMVTGLTPKLIQGIADALGFTSEQKSQANTTGVGAGISFFAGFDSAARSRFASWNPLAGVNTFRSMGAQGGAAYAQGGFGGSGSGAAIFDFANNYLGTPYVFGGESPGGFDCSGLMWYAYQHFGISIPRLSQEQFAYGKPVSNPRVGDLVFFRSSGTNSAPGHVGMYAGNGMFLEAPYTGASVRYSYLANRSDYVGARAYTYHDGGLIGSQGGGGEVLIHAQAGERVLSQEQSRLFEVFVREIGQIADEIREGNEEEEAFNEAFLAKLSERLDALAGYTSRESARLAMQRAEFAPGGFDASEIAAMVHTLTTEIEHLDMAVAEAEAQLNEAKWMKLPQAEINRLAENLFGLRTEAADARQELEELERIPLEQAADQWANAISNVSAMMDLLSNHSNSFALMSAQFPGLMGAMGGSYQTNLDLMRGATLPSDIMGYGSAALSDLSSMYGAEQSQLQRALDSTLDSIDDSQDAYEKAWQARADALDDQIEREQELFDEQMEQQEEALSAQLEDLSDAHADELDALNKYYDDKLRTLDDREREITRAEERNRAAKSVAGLEDELRILRGQGYYTEADIARMRELETQIQEQRDEMTRQEAAWAREDERTRLQRERDEAVASLQQQQELEQIALEDQVEAARKSLEAQREAQRKSWEARREALEEERRLQQEHFDELREQAQAAYQAELDKVIEKYAQLMQEVIDAQTTLLGQAGTYQNAGYTLGVSFADGILAAIPAIQAAAQAAAEAAAQYLQLNSPADKGPLSTLDRWWEKFAPTLYQPLVAQDFMRPVMDTYGPSQGPTVTEEHIYLHTDPGANIDVDTLCDLVSRKIGRRVEKAQWGA
jgi:TP901 family phage tail tape measure protein